MPREMNETHRIFAQVSGVFASGSLINWLVLHGPVLISLGGGAIAIIAGAYSIRSSRANERAAIATQLLREAELKKLNLK